MDQFGILLQGAESIKQARLTVLDFSVLFGQMVLLHPFIRGLLITSILVMEKCGR